uniref:Uncharacterized protein n=1 Tax=Caenorhabditis tropicalis TaxID=1561998 RepID=A0A1I7UWU5_9PELO
MNKNSLRQNNEYGESSMLLSVWQCFQRQHTNKHLAELKEASRRPYSHLLLFSVLFLRLPDYFRSSRRRP